MVLPDCELSGPVAVVYAVSSDEEALTLDWGQGIPLDDLRKAITWEFGSGAEAAKPW